MNRPQRMKQIMLVLADWNPQEPFTAEKFASAYNEKYSHYAITSSGFYTYFLKLEKAGRVRIHREDGKKHTYEYLPSE